MGKHRDYRKSWRNESKLRFDGFDWANSRVKQSTNEKKRKYSVQWKKYENAAVSVDETELVTALIAVTPKDYYSSINTQKSQLKQDINEMSNVNQV